MAAGILVCPASGWASGGGSWRSVARIAANRALTGLSCPSASFCVAVDDQGDVLESSDPAGDARGWRVVDVDGTNRLVGISCPSVGLCVAVDSAGDAVWSSDPTGGPAAWTKASLDPSSGLIAVSCPSVSLCVAAGGTDLLVSHDPVAGASSWTRFAGADSSVGPECGKYGGDSGCAVTLSFLSCASATFCGAIDDEDGAVSGDPSTGTWTSSGVGDGKEVFGLACLPGSSTCLSECAVGDGFGGYDCTGASYDATDICHHTCFTISAQQPAGLWCPAARLCFSTDDNGDLFASVNPTQGASAWWLAFVDSGGQPLLTRYNPLVGVSCPTQARCVAVDTSGYVLLGTPPPTPAEIGSLLSDTIAPGHRTSQPPTILHSGYTFKISIGIPGRLAVSWYLQTSSTLIASARTTISPERTQTIKLKLNRSGKLQLAREHAPVTLIAKATYQPAGSSTIKVRKTFTLR